MADKKISELNQTINVTGEELVPILIDGQNKVVKTKYLKGADNLTGEYVDLIGDDGNTYRMKVVNGKASFTKIDAFTAEGATEGENATFDGLIINQMYGGGDAMVGFAKDNDCR